MQYQDESFIFTASLQTGSDKLSQTTLQGGQKRAMLVQDTEKHTHSYTHTLYTHTKGIEADESFTAHTVEKNKQKS